MDKNEDENEDAGTEAYKANAALELAGLAGKVQQTTRPATSDYIASKEVTEALKAQYALRPDESGERLDIMSGMDRLITYVTNKIQNATIYTRIIRTDSSRFQAEFVAMANVGGKTYTATYSTPGYATGMNDEQSIREGDLIIDSLAKNLGRRIFVEDTPYIPDGAIVTFDYPERW